MEFLHINIYKMEGTRYGNAKKEYIFEKFKGWTSDEVKKIVKECFLDFFSLYSAITADCVRTSEFEAKIRFKDFEGQIISKEVSIEIKQKQSGNPMNSSFEIVE